jgi:hypothetical protein
MFDFLSRSARNGLQISFWPEQVDRRQRFIEELQQRGIEVINGPAWSRNLRKWLADNGHYLDYVLLGKTDLSNAFIEEIRGLTRAKFVHGQEPFTAHPG